MAYLQRDPDGCYYVVGGKYRGPKRNSAKQAWFRWNLGIRIEVTT